MYGHHRFLESVTLVSIVTHIAENKDTNETPKAYILWIIRPHQLLCCVGLQAQKEKTADGVNGLFQYIGHLVMIKYGNSKMNYNVFLPNFID